MTTPNFELPEWEQNQDQPHVTVNTALRIVECLAQLVVQSRGLSEPPDGTGAAIDGECFIIAGAGSGDWLDHDDGDIAMFIGTGWEFRSPKIGWEGYVVDEDVKIRFAASSATSGWTII